MARTTDTRAHLLSAAAELIWLGSYGSTSVDDICLRAGVKKGSFYHFFHSKSELVATALREAWESEKRPVLDRVFSPSVPPVERLIRFLAEGRRHHEEMCALHGRVLGCPLCTLGSEVSTQDAELRVVVDDILTTHTRYLASAIRDGMAAGVISPADPEPLAAAAFALLEGTLARARIQNSLDPLRDLERHLLRLIGVKEGHLAA